jgi:ABC-2 type transport system ATP-binding protein
MQRESFLLKAARFFGVLTMGKLECKEITKIYQDHRKALDTVSFTVETKGIFGLIGRNGAGKTTLIRILSTELEPTSGTATINDFDILENTDMIRERIAIVPQDARAISWMTPKQTIMSYLLWRGYPYKQANQLAVDSLQKFKISKYANILNSNLSGGTRRKVLISTITASEAQIIFLDEPTTGLDPISRRELWDILRELGKDRFVFLTTHYLEEAEHLADRIGILKEGKLVSIGNLSELSKGSKYQYSIKLAPKVPVPKVNDGEITVGNTGYTQIMTNEAEAFRLARLLSEHTEKFSISPVTLDDIFFRIIGQKVSEAT